MTEVPTPPSIPDRPALWLRVLLFGSLALNLLVVGTVVTLFALHGEKDGDRRGPPRADRMGGPLTFALSDEDRHAIGRAMREAYRAGRPDRGEVQAQYRAVVDALRSDPYDPAVVEQSLTRQSELAQDRQRIGNRLLLERLAAMNAEDRAAYADRIEEALDRWARRREARERDRDD